MCGKILILVLLGCALTLASPIPKNEKPIQPKHDINIGLWLQNAHEEIKQNFKQTVQQFEKTYYSLVEAGKNGHKYSVAQIEQLRSAFHEIIDKAREELSDIEVIILTNTIGNLQNAVEYLSIKAVQSVKRNLDSSGVENAKELASNGLKLAKGGANKFGSDAQQALNSGKNIIDKGVENVKEHISQGGDVGGLTEGVNEFANQAQATLNNGMHEVQNQFNQYAPSTNGVEDYQVKAYDSRLQLDKIAELLTELVAVHIKNVLQNLKYWRSIVNNFLASGQNQFEHDGKLSGVVEGMKNVQGNFGQPHNIFEGIGHGMISGVAQGIKNIQGTFGQLTNMAEGVGHGVLSGVAGGIKNVQGTFGHLTNMAEGIGHGMLSGVSESMKSVREKLQNLANGMVNNIRGNVATKLPNVAEGMSNIQESFGKFPNFVGGVQRSFQMPNYGENILNMPGSAGYVPDIDEEFVPEQSFTGDGRFKKIGQRVGGDIGGNVDRFTNALGGIWQNAANIFGR